VVSVVLDTSLDRDRLSVPPAMFWGAGRLVNAAGHGKKQGALCCDKFIVVEFTALVLV